MDGAADSALTPEQLRALWNEYMIEGARYNDMEDVEESLRHGADCNATDSTGRTALHMAAANGCLEIVRRLLAAGANTEQANSEGSTALHWACVGGHKDVVALLLQHGANPAALNKMERTPVDETLENPEVLSLFQTDDASGTGALESEMEGMEGGAQAESFAADELDGGEPEPAGASSSADDLPEQLAATQL